MKIYIYIKFYNNILKETSLKEIKDYNLKPIGGGVVWWLIPLASAAVSSAQAQDQENQKPLGFAPAPHFKQSEDIQTPNIYQSSQNESVNNDGGSLSSNLMGDYSSQPRYGPQDNANPWQGQLMSQLFQQQTDTSRSPSEPTKTGGGGK